MSKSKVNDILKLKVNFFPEKNNGYSKSDPLPKNAVVHINHLESLKNSLSNVLKFWEEKKFKIIKPLVNVCYKQVIAKSNRIKAILKENVDKNNASIVGAKLVEADGKLKHVITHCLDIESITKAIKNLENVISIAHKIAHKYELYKGITNETLDVLGKENIFDLEKKNGLKITKTRFKDTISDAFYVESFDVQTEFTKFNEDTIISIYDTGVDTKKILEELQISIESSNILNNTTLLLNFNQYEQLKQKAPFLIAMAVEDFSSISKEELENSKEKIGMQIPKPTNEPIIGVIDTMFDERVYFSKWVTFENKLDKNILLKSDDYWHGTTVSSIIVDGANINKDLDDGCGRFRVKHFGVAVASHFSSFSILKMIEEIILCNKDIKVWNLSLGSKKETNSFFISPEAAILDKIQFENNIIFVIAGTNDHEEKGNKRLGAPADSVNSLVVNSVSRDDRPASYSRKGKVLTFFNKPDVSYFGGDSKKKIRVCCPTGEAFVAGTSYAAPWIARKLAFLIHIMGFSRELAKALIIHSTTKWANKNKTEEEFIGYGVVPQKIEDVIKSEKSEIQFLIEGTTLAYKTNFYSIPIPQNEGKFPFISKATLCYFPKCSRNQGVDYTNTEMDIQFGRIIESKKNKKNKIVIDTINNNKQSGDEENTYIYEKEARKRFQKWNNVKHIRENLPIKTGQKSQKTKSVVFPHWGISIIKKERLNSSDGNNQKFGIVVTLKEIENFNRISEFIKNCQSQNLIVHPINIDEQINIYNKAEEDLKFK